MKYRQAKKIVKNEFDGWLLYNSPRLMKAITVFIHHQKKTHLKFYESRGILKQLRMFYEEKHNK